MVLGAELARVGATLRPRSAPRPEPTAPGPRRGGMSQARPVLGRSGAPQSREAIPISEIPEKGWSFVGEGWSGTFGGMSREDGTRTHAELRKEIEGEVGAALRRWYAPAEKASNTGREVRCEIVETKDPEPGHVATVWVRDLEQEAPAKGERPWHKYRVVVSEEY